MKDVSPRSTIIFLVLMISSMIGASIYAWPLNDIGAISVSIGSGLIGYLLVTTIQEQRKLKK